MKGSVSVQSKPLLFLVNWDAHKLLLRFPCYLPLFLRLNRLKTQLRVSEDIPPGPLSFFNYGFLLTSHSTGGQFCHSTALLTKVLLPHSTKSVHIVGAI